MAKRKILDSGLTFESVRVVPSYSEIRSRYGKQIDTSTKLARRTARINVPTISSNMDTVTEWEMATEMALHGGLGIIHRFMPIEKQAAQVRLVKERMRTIEENPPTLPAKATIADAKKLLNKRERGYVIVHEGENFTGKFAGIATVKDFKSANEATPITKVMTPNTKGKMIVRSVGTTMQQAIKVMSEHRIEKLPIINRSGKLVGVYTTKDYEFFSNYPTAALDKQGRLMVGGAIGVKPTDIARAHLLVEAGVDVLVIDIAHGHHIYVKETLKQLRKEKVKLTIIAGNVATYEGARFLGDLGADAVKVGIGPGHVCETRDVAGVGVPQITAIMEARRALKGKIPVIADGGIRNSGDVAIAIAAGADSVMIGTMLAGTDKSPGEYVTLDGILHKLVRGMASSSAFRERQNLENPSQVPDKYVPEGRETATPYRGPTAKVLQNLVGGLRSGMSYAGAHTITEMQDNSQLVLFPSGGTPEQKRPLGG